MSTFEGQDSEENREEEDRQDEVEAMETVRMFFPSLLPLLSLSHLIPFPSSFPSSPPSLLSLPSSLTSLQEMERKALNFLCSAPSALPSSSSSSSSSHKQPPRKRVKWLNGGGDAGAEGSRFAEHADLLADPLLSFPALVSERSSFLFKSSEDARAASKKLGGSSSRVVLETSMQEEELAGMASDRPSPLLCPLSWEANASMLNNS